MRSVLIAILALALCVGAAAADPPLTMSYQGVLTDNAGAIVADGDYSMTFRIYTVASSGSDIWTETQLVAVASGRFNVILGSTNPLAIDFDVPYWLGIAVAGDPEMTPRTELASAGYALRARTDGDWDVVGNDMQSGVSGAVGIGGAPVAKFHVHGNAEITTSLEVGTVLQVGSDSYFGGALNIPATTRYYTIPSEQFSPNGDGYSYTKNTVQLYGNAPSGSAYFGTGVHLPHGAVVTQLTALVDDTSASHDVTVQLRRMNLSDGSFAAMGIASSSGWDGGVTTIVDNVILNSAIDNENFAYSLQMYFTNGSGSQVKFKGLRIAYTITEPLP